MTVTYSEPDYILAAPAAASLSDDTRPTRLSPQGLLALNHVVDELLHLVIHSALHSTPSPLTPTSSPTGGLPTQPPIPLGPEEVLTSDRFKSALARILGPTSLAKECILEAELAVRELVRRGSPSLRGDGALKRAQGIWGSPVLPSRGSVVIDEEELVRQASDVFRGLRAWTMQLSGLGAACPQGSSTAPVPLQEHLVALMPPRPAPEPSPHVTFILALYVERVLTTLGSHLLRLVAGVVARSATTEVAGAADVETALMEDTLVWSWLQGMRVRTHIADEAALERARIARGSPTLSQEAALPRRSVSTAAGPSGASALPSTGAGSTRKASLKGPRRPSNDAAVGAGSVASAPTYARKGSLSTGLGISTTPPPAVPQNGDAFDQLLNSGRTLKLSSTPDRLRTFENRANGTVTGAAASPKDASGRRLRARDPQPRHLFAEEDEDAAAAATSAERNRRESFMDLLNSAPPGSLPVDAAVPASHRLSVAPRRPVPTDDPSHPMSVAMRVQESHDSVQSVDSVASEGLQAGDSPRTRAYKAKDEKRDLASERQINRDLAQFFANPPPAVAATRSSASDDAAPARQPASPTKSRSGLRGLMSMVTGGGSSSRKDSSSSSKDSEPRASLDPPSSPPPPSYRSHSSLSAQSSSAAPPATTSVSQAAMRAAGFGESVALAAKAAAYAAPPGLASSSQRRASYDRAPASPGRGATAEARQGRRSKSVVAAVPEEAPISRPASVVQRKAPPSSIDGGVAPPVSGASASANGCADGHVGGSADGHAGPAPPIPAVPGATPNSSTALGPPISIKPPRRSSSLKRSAREREQSRDTGATGTSLGRRTRESSAGSATVSRGPSPAPHQLVEVESAAPPVVVVPSKPGSADAHEGEPPSAEVEPATSVALAGPTDERTGVAPAEVEAVSPASEDPAVAPVVVNGGGQAPPLAPVEEVPTPSSTVFTAPGPAQAEERQQSTTRPSTPPLPFFSPGTAALPGHLTTATLSGTKSIVALLKELRSAMLLAQSRDECLELVEGMLRDQARRVEALAQREREEVEGQQSVTKDAGLSVVHVEQQGKDPEEAVVAEALLGGASTPTDATPLANGHAGTEDGMMPIRVDKVVQKEEPPVVAATA